LATTDRLKKGQIRLLIPKNGANKHQNEGILPGTNEKHRLSKIEKSLSGA
jgi:hypothetical protein